MACRCREQWPHHPVAVCRKPGRWQRGQTRFAASRSASRRQIPQWLADGERTGHPQLAQVREQVMHRPVPACRTRDLPQAAQDARRTKSQIQALDRSQPVLPIRPGMPERRTHDSVRNGLTTLFAAFDVATGEVITALHRRHRAVEFKKFLIWIDKEVPAHLQVHLIVDNYGTHKTPAIRAWLAKHPRFELHFTPTGSWYRAGWRVSVNTLAQLMAELGLAGHKIRRRRGLTRPGKRPAAPDFVRRET